MTERDFSLRLSRLREEKGVSARDMSLSMGQNPGYINNIESGKQCHRFQASFTFVNILESRQKTSLILKQITPQRPMNYIPLQEDYLMIN